MVFGYADDIAIVVRGLFLSILRDRMNDALSTMRDWCETRSLAVNPPKTKIMVFTRKYKPEAIGPFKLWGREVLFTDTVKYLGIFLDLMLTKKQNITYFFHKATYLS